jgi:hypothetical protein
MGAVLFHDRSGRACSFRDLSAFSWGGWSIRLAALGAILLAAPSFALAAGVSPTIVLPGAISYESFGLNNVDNTATSNTIGTLNYADHVGTTGAVGAGCGGICIATTALGADPFATISVNEISYENTSGGFDDAELAFYVEYYVPGGATTASYPVTLDATDTLSISGGGSSGQAYLGFARANNNYGAFDNFAGNFLVNETDCLGPTCQFVNDSVTKGPFPAQTSLELTENTLYFLEFWVQIAPHATGLPNTVTVDPILTSSATAGTLIYSPGIGKTVPEPSTWAMMLLGFAGLGYAAYRRGGQVRQAIA